MMASVLAGASHPLTRLWRCYEQCLEQRPMVTQSLTSGVLWGVGDVLAQRFTSASRQRLDVRRTALTAVFGGAVIGPTGTWWYRYLDRLALLFGPEGTLRFLLAKLAADSTVWNIWYMSAFFLWGEMVIEGGTLRDWTKQMEDEFVPTYLAEVAAWPPIMAAIFTRLPTSHHLLAVNVVTVLDVAFLALIRSGAFRSVDIGGFPVFNPTHDDSSQGEELCNEALAGAGSSGSAGASSKPTEGPRLSVPPYLVPALASMHSVMRRASGPVGLLTGGRAQLQQQQGGSLVEAWVLPEHREQAGVGRTTGQGHVQSAGGGKAQARR